MKLVKKGTILPTKSILWQFKDGTYGETVKYYEMHNSLFNIDEIGVLEKYLEEHTFKACLDIRNKYYLVRKEDIDGS